MAPSPTIRRLLRETAELSAAAANPSPAFHAAPVSDADLHEWHFTLLGPPSPSPYAGGLYHGRITLPPQYPLKPPNFRFLTPSGRFEVNREICLSISGFHEETWMPAWGVRTALTALRTFMAEPGTAGQVGGLEAPEHVRKRLASESRGWRCGGCEKTNEQVMQEWWASCREQGVKVDEEGADVGLEVLPEGMAVEARDVGNAKGKGTETQQTPSQPQPQAQTQPSQQPVAPSIAAPDTQTTASPQGAHSEPLQGTAQRQQHSLAFSPTPTPETIQRAAEARLTPSDLAQPPTSQRPMMNLHAPPLAAAAAALEQHAALQATTERDREQREGSPTVTIDRAIAGVFLMLVAMVLKKMFWSAGTATEGLGDGQGWRGWHMEREL